MKENSSWPIRDAPLAGVLAALLLGATLVVAVQSLALVALPGVRLLVGLEPVPAVEAKPSASSSSSPRPTPLPKEDPIFPER